MEILNLLLVTALLTGTAYAAGGKKAGNRGAWKTGSHMKQRGAGAGRQRAEKIREVTREGPAWERK